MPHPIFLIETSVISTTRKLKIQFEAVARAEDLARTASGEDYGGSSRGIARRPMAKQKMKKNSMKVAERPAFLPPLCTVTARTAIATP